MLYTLPLGQGVSKRDKQAWRTSERGGWSTAFHDWWSAALAVVQCGFIGQAIEINPDPAAFAELGGAQQVNIVVLMSSSTLSPTLTLTRTPTPTP